MRMEEAEGEEEPEDDEDEEVRIFFVYSYIIKFGNLVVKYHGVATRNFCYNLVMHIITYFLIDAHSTSP